MSSALFSYVNTLKESDRITTFLDGYRLSFLRSRIIAKASVSRIVAVESIFNENLMSRSGI